MLPADALVVPFEAVGLDALADVGGKNASLGELIRHLSPLGIRVPEGFATTAAAYRQLLDQGELRGDLTRLLHDLDSDDLEALQRVGAACRRRVLAEPLPAALQQAITGAYRRLSDGPEPLAVAVRSSATAEDLPEASFAGQQESFLNIQGENDVLEACRHCYASLFTDRAISYRQIHGYEHLDVALSIGVQRLVRSDLACSGVMFTLDTETGFRDVVLITAAYGLGETIVQGAVNPDELMLFKPTLQQGFTPIISRRLGSKAIRMVCEPSNSDLGSRLRTLEVPPEWRHRFALADDDALILARWACLIEEHYTALHQHDTPMDLEWAKDGLTGELFILQARPETVQSQACSAMLQRWHIHHEGAQELACGQAIGSSVSSGRARVIADPSDIRRFQPGDLLVTRRTDPDWEPILRQASGVVTDQGGRTCHAAIIAREMGITAIVGTGTASECIPDGEMITASCCEGDVGHVYRGLLRFDKEEQALDELPATDIKIMLNVGHPEEAFNLSRIPCDGVGLARLEFIIANHIKIHPLALIHLERVSDTQVRERITELTQAYSRPQDYYVDLLSQGMARIAAAFYPRPVVLRFSDFKSNEYARLLGGSDFEPQEENPMLGWRGASRYTSDVFRPAFALECQALRSVRDDMGLVNVIPMIPFCRTPEEADAVLAEMGRQGLRRGLNGLKVYAMCELPSNVIGMAAFAERLDGFSIGSNDLTQLTLGLDRDSALVAAHFDERHPTVIAMVRLAIRGAHAARCRIGICGQAPSDYPEFVRFLVEEGIDSISLNADSLISTRLAVAAIEAELAQQRSA